MGNGPSNDALVHHVVDDLDLASGLLLQPTDHHHECPSCNWWSSLSPWQYPTLPKSKQTRPTTMMKQSAPETKQTIQMQHCNGWCTAFHHWHNPVIQGRIAMLMSYVMEPCWQGNATRYMLLQCTASLTSSCHAMAHCKIDIVTRGLPRWNANCSVFMLCDIMQLIFSQHCHPPMPIMP